MEYVVLLALLAIITITPAVLMGWDVQRLFGRSAQEVAQVASTAAQNPNPTDPAEEEGEEEDQPLILRVTVNAGDVVEFYVGDPDGQALGTVLEIDWGAGASAPFEADGATVCPTTAEVAQPGVVLRCTYQGAGTHRVRVGGTIPTLARLATSGKVDAVEDWGKGNGLSSLYQAFQGATKPIDVPANLPPTVTVLQETFLGWGDVPVPAAISSWDVSRVQFFDSMFDSTHDIPDITGWNTGSGQSFSTMFHGSRFNQDISGWDMASAQFLSAMFMDAPAFNQDLNAWDVGAAQDFWGMFYRASSFNGAVGEWDMSSATNMASMFRGATAFNQPVDGWDTSSVTRMDRVFMGATAFNQPVGGWDTSNVSTFEAAFSFATAFNQPLDSWNVGSGTIFQQMFDGASAFDQDLNSWDMSKAQNVSGMFQGAVAFDGDISAWDTSSVLYFGAMFGGAARFNQDLSAWDVGHSVHFPAMFRDATSFTSDLSGWNVSKGAAYSMMFQNARNLRFDISGWRIGPITKGNNINTFIVGSKIYGDMRCFNVKVVSQRPAGFADTGFAAIPGNYEPLWGQVPSASCTP